VKLGSENTESIRNVIVTNCTISDSNRGIAIQNRDEGVVENVLFSNILIETRLFGDEWWGKAEPIYITALERAADELRRFPADADRRIVGSVRNIRFSNILCRGENGVYVSGSSDSRPSEILFDDVTIEIEKKTSYRGGCYDRRPTGSEPIEKGGSSGIYLRHADEIRIHSCQVRWHGKLPDYFGPALRGRDVTGLEIRDLRGDAAHPEQEESVILEDCTGEHSRPSSQYSQ
jgi:parallel beta-helix repeat protein